jgi:capsid assembly protease
MHETAAALLSQPWAVERRQLGILAAGLTSYADAVRPAPLADRSGGSGRGERSRPAGGVAVLPVWGTMTQRDGPVAEYLGLLPTELVGQWVDLCAADDGIGTIVLDIDSPGGSVFGVAELGAKVAAAAKVKRVVAVANSMAASGAYWIASQASELVITPGGMVGSIGVFLVHVDRSEELRQAGLKVTFVAAGERKMAGNSAGPLDAAGREEFETQVNGYYDRFVRAVAAGRKTTLTDVRTGFGKGGMVLASAAVRSGMADRIATLDEVLAELGIGGSPSASGQGSGSRGRAIGHNHAAEVRRRREMLARDVASAKQRMRTEDDREIADMEIAVRRAELEFDPATAPPRTEWEERKAAFHEAGHAVVAIALGGRVELADIEPGPGRGGRVRNNLAGFAKMASSAAGFVAEAEFGFGNGIMPPNCQDRQRMDMVSDNPDHRDWARAKAREILWKHRPKVNAVAEALLQRRRLSGSEVHVIVGQLAA